ncbi:tetratricopeptide TPR4 [Streptomyces albus]|uniref:Tetratricopeptide TPR4 n=2 Tax=Streptomyces TaxID=1883 RepID=A0A0B5EPX1_STRA4|nr:tetratricopeptide TPR4 [Streptomyces albus]AOU77982.1 tetratricopeptide TPR_4 [Streptomyces albus]
MPVPHPPADTERGTMASAASQPPPGPAPARLKYRIELLHRQAGEPSYRVIAQRTGTAISHATAGKVLRCETPPARGPLELWVEALGGDREEFRALWVAVRDEVSPLVLPKPHAWEGEPEEPLSAVMEHQQPLSTGDLSIPELDTAEEDLHERATERSRREGETRKELLRALGTRADLSDHLARLHEQLGHERGRNEELSRQVR